MSRRQPELLFVLMLIGLIFFTLSLSACSPREPGRHYITKKGFSIKTPENWETKEELMGMAFVTLSPQEGPADDFRENVNIIVEDLPRTLSLEEYYELSLANVRQLLTEFEEYESGQSSINGCDTKWLVYSHRMGIFNIKVLVYSLIKGRRAYVITCSAAHDQFSIYRPQFEGIAGTFRFE